MARTPESTARRREGGDLGGGLDVEEGEPPGGGATDPGEPPADVEAAFRRAWPGARGRRRRAGRPSREPRRSWRRGRTGRGAARSSRRRQGRYPGPAVRVAVAERVVRERGAGELAGEEDLVACFGQGQHPPGLPGSTVDMLVPHVRLAVVGEVLAAGPRRSGTVVVVTCSGGRTTTPSSIRVRRTGHGRHADDGPAERGGVAEVRGVTEGQQLAGGGRLPVAGPAGARHHRHHRPGAGGGPLAAPAPWKTASPKEKTPPSEATIQ